MSEKQPSTDSANLMAADSGHGNTSFADDLAAIIEAAKEADREKVHSCMSALRKHGAFAKDFMAAMLMDSRTRESFMATTDLAFDEDIMDMLNGDDGVFDDYETLMFLQDAYGRYTEDYGFLKEVHHIYSSHQTRAASSEDVAAPAEDATQPYYYMPHMSGPYFYPFPGYGAGGYGVQYYQQRPGNQAHPPNPPVKDHDCLGPCRWHSKPQGCKWEGGCKYCHICPHKRPNKTTRQCQRLGMSKKQLQEYLKVQEAQRALDGSTNVDTEQEDEAPVAADAHGSSGTPTAQASGAIGSYNEAPSAEKSDVHSKNLDSIGSSTAMPPLDGVKVDVGAPVEIEYQ